MKVNVALTILMLSAAFCSAEDTNNTDAIVALARRFVGSLASDDIDAAKACWLSVDELKAFVADPPAGVDVSNIDDDDLAHIKTQCERRDKEIASRLRTLVDTLKKRNLDTSELQLLKATPERLSTEKGMTGIQQLEIVMAIGDSRIEYRLGGAGLYADRWYCVELCGSGATLIKNNRAESIRCEKPNK